MKEIINGKKYDTNTATEVGYYDNGRYGDDYSYVVEKLYQKRTGEFFLYGYGGALTEYREAWGSNNWSGSSRIVPFTISEAEKWAMEHLDCDEYEALFGPVEE